MTDSTWILVQWRLRLSESGFDIVHCAGVKHPCTDALLRLQATGEDDIQLEKNLLKLESNTKSDETNRLVINANSDKNILLNAHVEKPIDTSLTLEELVAEQARD